MSMPAAAGRRSDGAPVSHAYSSPIAASVSGGKRISAKPLLVELTGNMDDAEVQKAAAKLRMYRNSYFPILRIMLRLLSPSVSEVELFGDGTTRSPMFTALQWSVTAERTVCVTRRLGASNEVANVSLDEFMAYRFLPLAMTHNFMTAKADGTRVSFFSTEDVSNLVMRHYTHESTRTASFLIADLVSRTAVVIDPRLDVSPYSEDLARFNLQLKGVVLTHCFVDIALGVEELLRNHPKANLWCGIPLEPAGTIREIVVGPQVSLRTVAAPSFSPECLLVELHFHNVLIALFTGTACSTDALPRADYYYTFPLFPATCGENVQEDAMKVAQRSLKAFLYDRYFVPSASTSTSARGSASQPEEWLRHVLVFPSHGGYSHVTNQLDLYWTAHISDFLVMQHTRKMLDPIANEAAYVAHSKRAPPLPRPALFEATRVYNVRAALRILQERSSLCIPFHLQPAPRPLGVLVIDVRPVSAYHLFHLFGSVSVPMTFPAEAFRAKKAELWLQCLLLPTQPIVVVCETSNQKDAVRHRIGLISPEAVVEVYLVTDLLAILPTNDMERISAHSVKRPPRGGANGSSNFFAPRLAKSTFLPETLQWIVNARPLRRLDSYESTGDLVPRSSSIVVDVRTPFEFRNGSHQHSVHVQLAELCALTAKDAQHCASEQCHGPSPKLGLQLMQLIHGKALMSGLPVEQNIRDIRELFLYCAAGYRSLIAASLLQRAFDVSEPLADGSHLSDVEICDVAGGALQIMTQRPSLWRVKDRSIICIS